MRANRWLATAFVAVLASCGPASPRAMKDPAPPTTPTTSDAPRATLSARKGVTVELGDGGRLVVEDIVTETIAAAPGDEGAYPAGNGVDVTVTVDGQAGTMSLLSSGYTSTPVVWLRGFRIELVDADGLVAHLVVERVGTRVVASQPIRIRVGETVRLYDQVDFELVSHGHKLVEEDQESPLIVNVDYHQGPDPKRSHHVYPPREVTWTWHDLRFTLGAYDYGKSMDVVVDRLALDPL